MAKKRKIANNELIVLGSFAFVIAMFSTLGFLGGLDVTGLAVGDTAYGRVNATIESVVDISMAVSTVSFTGMQPSQVNESGNETAAGPRGLRVQNDGNVAIDINISSQRNGSALFNGTDTVDNFKWNCTIVDNVSNPKFYGICNLSGTWASTIKGRVNTTTTSAGDAGTAFCASLNYTDATDNATLNLRISIPADEPAWTTGSTIRFSAWQAAG